MDRLRFLHIPKTAGSTFTTCLEHQYSICSGKGHFIFAGDITSDCKRYMGLSVQERQSIQLFSGHAPIFTGMGDVDSAQIITLLRDPIDRVKSFIQHLAEGKSPEYFNRFFDLDSTLDSGLSDLSNLQAKMLINKGDFRLASLLESMSESEARDTALNNLFNVVTEFGIQEFLDESLIVFAKVLGWSIPFYATRNKKDGERRIDFKQRHLDRIADSNRIDMEVYSAAKDKFLSKLRGSEFDWAKKLRLINLLASPHRWPQKGLYHGCNALYHIMNKRPFLKSRHLSVYPLKN